MCFVNYKYLVEQGIVQNRVTLARSIENFGFPKPLQLGKNRLAWRLEEVEEWLESRPRVSPKSGDKKVSRAVQRAEA
jgi:hypothetical protein